MITNAGSAGISRLTELVESSPVLIPFALALKPAKGEDFEPRPDQENSAAAERDQQQNADEKANSLCKEGEVSHGGWFEFAGCGPWAACRPGTSRRLGVEPVYHWIVSRVAVKK